VKYALLTGEFDGLKLDDRNRLLIPAEIRQSIDSDRDGKAFYVTIGQNRKPWLYLQNHYESLVERDTPALLPTATALEFDQLHFSSTHLVPLDKLGRLLLPDKLLKRTGTEKTVTLIGARDHLEVWNGADWGARAKDLEDRRGEIALQARIDRQVKPVS
jgi:MraZ protein